jgi:hypothetical protein
MPTNAGFNLFSPYGVATKYVGGGNYEFLTPLARPQSNYYTYTGVRFYAGRKAPLGKDNQPVHYLLNPALESLPVNTWYSKQHLVTGGIAIRYANPEGNLSQYPTNLFDYPAQVMSGGASINYTSPVAINAAAVKGNYCFGITKYGTAYVWNMETKTLVHTQPIVIDVPADYDALKTVRGFWSFNREGTKACTSTWISQYQRFGGLGSPQASWLTSYIVEIEFVLDKKGVFTSIVITQTIETPNFVMAADYDWITEANELIYLELSTFSYQEHVVPITFEGSTYSIDRVIDGIARRSVAYNATNGYTYPRYNDAYDMWAEIKQLNGTVLKSIELIHNRNYIYDVSGHEAHSWWDIRGDATNFSNIITGLDLRVRGITLQSTALETAGNPVDAVRAEIYDKIWGDSLSKSTGQTRYPANYYWPSVILYRVKENNITQTIAAIPYRLTALIDGKIQDMPIRDCAVYAPAKSFNAAKALDFQINSTGIELQKYHENTYTKFYTATPFVNRYFVSGAWAKTKNRD